MGQKNEGRVKLACNALNAIKAHAPKMMDYLVRRIDTSFVVDIVNYFLPSKFKMPTLEIFDGTKDPLDHLDVYKSLMQLHNVPEEIM